MAPTTKVLTAGSSCLGQKAIEDHPLQGRILYVGGFNGANVDGLERFLRIIWPRVRRESGIAHLNVCGYVYRGFLGQEFDRVNFLGHMEDIEPEYENAWLIINPVWIGTGLKIKTVEAIARGKPIITTSKGIEGLDPQVRDACLIADTDSAFSEAILMLLNTPQERMKLAHSSAGFAKNHLTPQSVYKELMDFLEQPHENSCPH
jgi:succinoglycan biosynthesis protein ExoO